MAKHNVNIWVFKNKSKMSFITKKYTFDTNSFLYNPRDKHSRSTLVWQTEIETQNYEVRCLIIIVNLLFRTKKKTIIWHSQVDNELNSRDKYTRKSKVGQTRKRHLLTTHRQAAWQLLFPERPSPIRKTLGETARQGSHFGLGGNREVFKFHFDFSLYRTNTTKKSTWD